MVFFFFVFLFLFFFFLNVVSANVLNGKGTILEQNVS
jgi:hypothetical protein